MPAPVVGGIVAGSAILGTIQQQKAQKKAQEAATQQSQQLQKFAKSPITGSIVEGFLPPSLRNKFVGNVLKRGISGITRLIETPGQLSPVVLDAVRQRLAGESELIAQNFRGIRANQAGALARGNVPLSIRSALSSALDVSQARAQRGARRGALAESEGLKRADVGQTFNILDAILQFSSSGRGQAVAGLQGAGQLGLGQAQLAQQGQAANQALLGSLAQTFANLPRKQPAPPAPQ